ncbi:BICD family-like cargo adapter 2 isoform X2 [Nerophis ophidion]|uniref:BICD family-like cargo adapter 2 isoform X2 n=1 Tax=Nerophis ophidion TaxID=159077 RepID=UPI002ADFDF6A|nr:BICD family-like cargo adapter 2 isoform X2 [Nerophis ophidion]
MKLKEDGKKSETRLSIPHLQQNVIFNFLTEELGCILQLLLPLTQEQQSADYSDDTAQDESLNVVVHQLKTVAQSLVQASGSQDSRLQQENAEIQQAIRDRDEAIAKKNLMEAELVRSKNDMMSLNNQLLEAIQRKLELSQELEVWQDDIQIVINQQLRSQQQSEQPPKKTSPHGTSFFRKPSKAVLPWGVDANQDKAQSPWRDWLRRGKGVSHSK